MATGGQAPRIYFTAIDPLGQTVEVTKSRWAHAVKGHPAMLGQEQMVKDAIQNPETIHEGNTAQDKVFKAKSHVPETYGPGAVAKGKASNYRSP